MDENRSLAQPGPKRARLEAAPGSGQAACGHHDARAFCIVDDDFEGHLARLNQLRGRSVLTREENVDILQVYFATHRAAKLAEKRDNTKVPTKALEKTARLLGRAKGTVTKVVKQWTDNQQNATPDVYVGNQRGGKKQKPARIPHAKKIFFGVRDLILEKRTKGERITATQVLEFLQAKEFLSIKSPAGKAAQKAKDYDAAMRATQRFLLRKGFQRTFNSGGLSIRNQSLAMRDALLRTLQKNWSRPIDQRLREVYVDETYVHQSYRRDESSQWDPNDEQDQIFLSNTEGRAFCIVGAVRNAINGADPNCSPGGLVPGSELIFCPEPALSQCDDYLTYFDSASFSKWWKEQLLPNLSSPSLIMLSDSPHHKAVSPNTPRPETMSRLALLALLREYEISHSPHLSNAEARVLLREYIKTKAKPLVVELAEQAGHRVLFLPTLFADLLPMEKVWARVKGNIGRQYTSSTSLEDVRERLEKEFEALRSPIGCTFITECIHSSERKVTQLWKEVS